MADEAEKPAEATGTAEAVESSESGFRNRRLHNYPLIKNSDMNEEIRVEAMELCVTACEKHASNNEAAAKLIKETMDKKFGPAWHAVVGAGYGMEITHEVKNLLYMFFAPANQCQSEVPTSGMLHYSGEDPAVTRFRELLSIQTISLKNLDTPGPQPDYYGVVRFLEREAKEIGLLFKCFEVAPNRPVVIISWEGADPTLPSVMLNCHTDVVPVFQDKWECDAFSAYKKENGDIVARGSQDMKCCGCWYLEAVRNLRAAGKSFLRTIHMTFMPDEEVGSFNGMIKFVQREEFKELNVGFCLDEGLANPTDAFTVFYAERSPWWLTIHCPGNPGHGSRFIENTAVEKVRKILNRALDYRDSQEARLNSDPSLRLGDVTTLNVTMLGGGVQWNVVPDSMSLGMDLRVTITQDHQELLEMIQGWAREAGEDCTVEFRIRDSKSPVVSTDESDPWWRAFSSACKQRDLKVEKEVFPAGTDSRVIRPLGIPALGFSAINNTPILLHDHNEFLNERVFLKGIPIYEDIISNLASVKP